LKTAKKIKPYVLAICFLLSITFTGGEAAAKTYYVCKSGCDYNTIQGAANAVSAGDTVIVKDGIYTGSGTQVVRINKQGTSSNWITFKSENTWGAVIDGDATAKYVVNIAGSSYLKIEGFDITGSYDTVLPMNPASNIIVYNNIIRDAGKDFCSNDNDGNSGIHISTGSSHITIDSNIIHDNGRLLVGEKGCGVTSDNNDHGIYPEGKNIDIINNVFYNHDNGYHLHHAGADNVNVINNVFYKSNIHSNIIGGVVIWKDNDNVLFQNNIFYDPQGAVVDCYKPESSTVSFKNNLIYPSGRSITHNCGSISFSSSGTIWNDPKFQDLSARNYRITSGSPAIDAGLSLRAPSFDHDGNNRDSKPDIGAFEYGSVAGGGDYTPPRPPILLSIP
jgi:hypothetical protein